MPQAEPLRHCRWMLQAGPPMPWQQAAEPLQAGPPVPWQQAEERLQEQHHRRMPRSCCRSRCPSRCRCPSRSRWPTRCRSRWTWSPPSPLRRPSPHRQLSPWARASGACGTACPRQRPRGACQLGPSPSSAEQVEVPHRQDQLRPGRGSSCSPGGARAEPLAWRSSCRSPGSPKSSTPRLLRLLYCNLHRRCGPASSHGKQGNSSHPPTFFALAPRPPTRLPSLPHAGLPFPPLQLPSPHCSCRRSSDARGRAFG
mmetsp:Transcript_2651/g.5289  ORF Transcript_2651/g.5289 Transcript_2651/m.5289 type:complete len:255 (-) Transcript_2651:681-1445(-)